MISVSLLAKIDAQGRLVCEGGEAFGLDVSASIPTPVGEFSRVDMHLDGANPALLQALLGALGGMQPVGVRGMPLAIREDGSE